MVNLLKTKGGSGNSGGYSRETPRLRAAYADIGQARERQFHGGLRVPVSAFDLRSRPMLIVPQVSLSSIKLGSITCLPLFP